MKTLKTLLACCVLAAGLLTQSIHAANGKPQATLAWDASPETGVTYTLTAVRLVGGLPVQTVYTDCGTNLTADVVGLAGGTWEFVVQAKLAGLFSVPSNTLRLNLPAPPSNLTNPITSPTAFALPKPSQPVPATKGDK